VNLGSDSLGKLQVQNLAMFSHSAVTPIAYLQHTPAKHALITR